MTTVSDERLKAHVERIKEVVIQMGPVRSNEFVSTTEYQKRLLAYIAFLYLGMPLDHMDVKQALKELGFEQKVSLVEHVAWKAIK